MKRLIVDVSSLMWSCLLVGKDPEFGREVEHEGKRVWVNGWQYGFENAINSLTTALGNLDLVPHQVILVHETGMTKARRLAISREYKAQRGSRPQEAYAAFNEAKERVIQALLNVGAQAVTQDACEADDIIAYLCQNLDGHKVIMSNDGDMAALMSDTVSLYRKAEIVTDNPFGPFSPRWIVVYKALVGDTSDGYSGARGFGEKAFLDLLVWAGEPGLAAIEGMIKRKTLHELEEDIPEFKPLKKVVEGAAGVYTSYELALLRPEWVNTLRQPLIWRAGMVRGRDVVTDERLVKWAQQVRLVIRDNFDKALEFFKAKVAESPIVALDIETSTPEESDEWLAAGGRENKVDVFGSELTGLSLTFGSNGQYTFYFSVDHIDTANVASEQVRQVVELIPQSVPIAIQNFAFEGPILYAEWGEAMKDNGWHGFLPNVIDTAILSNYVDENLPRGLKQNSKHYLGYEQETYEQVTTIDGVSHKMNELSGAHVLSYGADDTICTAALFHHFRIRMEIEKTWDVMLEVEQLPAYVTALAYHQGTKFSLERMREIEKDDAATYEKHWAELREFLIKQGWEGTVTPHYDELTPANIKEAFQIITGGELKTQVRTVSKLAKLIEVEDHEDAPLLARFVEEGSIDQINDWVAKRFNGEPQFDLDSPTKMRKFLYDTLGLPVRIVNATTATERQKKPDLARAVTRHKKIWAGSKTEAPLTDTEKELLKAKAKTDDTAIDFALALDAEEGSETARVLKCIQVMKKCSTRAKMFYTPYANLRHWKDGKIHGQAGQCGTVTRRFAPSEPNLAQLPKKGEGVKFRECFLPHRRDAVMVSLDFSGQELRQGAGQSGDPNMMACYVGDNLKDMHSMTAAGAMEKKWGKDEVLALSQRFGETDPYTLFLKLRKCHEDPAIAKKADDLRKSAKNVNFGAQYDAQAPKLAETLIIPVDDAEAFLQAKFAMFPRFEEWKDEVKAEAQKLGYVTTPMGGRRHLREALLSEEWGVADKALRQGPNFKIQGASAEQTKLAMARLWKSGILFNLDMVFFAPIHDELVWSVHRDHALESIKAVHHCMTQPYGGLPVPFLASISLGPNFGEQHECGDWIIEENIKKAIDEVFAKEVATV